MRAIGPFVLGAVLPVAIFLVPYVASDAVGAFVRGVFVLPTKRFGVAEFAGLPFWTMLAVLAPAAFVLLEWRLPTRARRMMGLVAICVAVALLWVTAHSDPVYRGVWYAARNALPVLVALGVALLARTSEERGALRRDTMAVLCIAAACNLVQFPYAVPNYFCYVAPLVLLAALALYAWERDRVRMSAGVLLAFGGAFAVLRVSDSTLNAMGVVYRPYYSTAPLPLARAGIRVPVDQVGVYRRLVPMLRQRARDGYTWASPDVPEIYFLSGLRNPTRTLFDFFDDPADRSARVLRALDEHGVTAIVLNRRPAFSPPVPDDLAAALEQRYPFAIDLWPFQLRWRP